MAFFQTLNIMTKHSSLLSLWVYILLQILTGKKLSTLIQTLITCRLKLDIFLSSLNMHHTPSSYYSNTSSLKLIYANLYYICSYIMQCNCFVHIIFIWIHFLFSFYSIGTCNRQFILMNHAQECQISNLIYVNNVYNYITDKNTSSIDSFFLPPVACVTITRTILIGFVVTILFALFFFFS